MYLPALLRKNGLKKWFWLFYSSSLFVILLMLPLAVHAQTNSSSVNTQQNTNIVLPQNQPYLIQSTFIEVLAAGVCQLADIDVFHPNQGCLKIDPTTHQLSLSQKSNGGLIGMGVSMIASTFTPPASSTEFLSYVKDNFGITRPVFAQEGPGFQSLSPLIKIWSAFRNIAYLFFILAFALIGLAIMLRVKIDPRTVMTIQNQIPKIIVCIILITFSYAIAGMMIDLMYVGSYVLINTFANPNITSTRVQQNITKNVNSSYFADNPIGFTNNLFGLQQIITGTAGGIKDITAKALSSSFNQQNDVRTGLGDIIRDFLGVVFDNVIFSALGNILSWFVGLAAIFIVAIAVFIALIRLWFILIKAYVYILLDVAIAPLWIAAGLIPGSTVNFTSWFRHLSAHILVFPAALGLFLLCAAFMDSFGVYTQGNAADQANYFHAPLIGNFNNVQMFGSIIAFGFLLIAPTLLDQLRDILKAQPSKYSAELGRGFSRGAAPVGAVLGTIRGEVFRRDTHGQAVGPGAVGARNLWNRIRFRGKPEEQQHLSPQGGWAPFGQGSRLFRRIARRNAGQNQNQEPNQPLRREEIP